MFLLLDLSKTLAKDKALSKSFNVIFNQNSEMHHLRKKLCIKDAKEKFTNRHEPIQDLKSISGSFLEFY